MQNSSLSAVVSLAQPNRLQPSAPQRMCLKDALIGAVLSSRDTELRFISTFTLYRNRICLQTSRSQTTHSSVCHRRSFIMSWHSIMFPDVASSMRAIRHSMVVKSILWTRFRSPISSSYKWLSMPFRDIYRTYRVHCSRSLGCRVWYWIAWRLAGSRQLDFKI